MSGSAIWIGLAQCVSWGVLFYSFGMVLPAMQVDLGGHPVAMSGAFSTALFVSALAGVLVGRLIDAGLAKGVFLGGIGIGAIALVGWSTSRSLWQLYMSMIPLGIAMACTFYEPVFALIDGWNEDQAVKHKALATVTLLGGLASPMVVPVLGVAINHLGWRWAIASAALPLMATALIYRRVIDCHQAAISRDTSRPVLFTPLLWWIAAAAFVSSFAGVVLSSYLPRYLTYRGFSLTVPTVVIAAVGIAQIPARLLVLPTIGRWSAARTFALALVAQAASLVAIVVSKNLPAFAVAGAVFGAGNGAAILLRAIGIRESATTASYGTLIGRIAVFPVVARAIAPLAGGIMSVPLPAEPLLVSAAGLTICFLGGTIIMSRSTTPTRL